MRSMGAVVLLGIGISCSVYASARLLGWPSNAQPIVLQAKTCDDHGAAVFGLVYSDGSIKLLRLHCDTLNLEVDHE